MEMNLNREVEILKRLVYDLRKNGGGGGSTSSSIPVQDTAPTSPSNGDLWFNSSDLTLYVYYDDGSSSQWVEALLEGGGGPSVTQYATVAELITASQGGLAEGYYEVTTVPEYHPQYPRIITYWDGATFEPQISTGFEDRPALAEERFVWDAREHAFRVVAPNRITTELVSQVQESNPLVVCSGSAGNSSGCVYTFSSATMQYNMGASTGALFVFAGSGAPKVGADDTFTMMFAGNFSRQYTASTITTLGCIGRSTERMTLRTRSSSVPVFEGYVRGTTLTHSAVPRVEGDVVIMAYTQSTNELAIWVNGVRESTTVGTTLNVSTNQFIIGNEPTSSSTISRPLLSFGACAQTFIDDTAAAEWTAWLQDRYGIPEL